MLALTPPWRAATGWTVGPSRKMTGPDGSLDSRRCVWGGPSAGERKEGPMTRQANGWYEDEVQDINELLWAELERLLIERNENGYLNEDGGE